MYKKKNNERKRNKTTIKETLKEGDVKKKKKE